MKLFAVIYLKGHILAAMFLWNGATLYDCQQINAAYAQHLPSTPGIKSGAIKLADVRLACEWHDVNPVADPVKK